MGSSVAKTPLISIVDDDDLIRAAIQALVRSIGLSARTFASAEAFLQSAYVGETQCLIVDVQMPNMSGMDLQDRLSHLGVDIPIIFITGFPDEIAKARALNKGAIDFLQKPHDLQGQRFVDCMSDALNKRKGASTNP